MHRTQVHTCGTIMVHVVMGMRFACHANDNEYGTRLICMDMIHVGTLSDT